MPVSIRLSRIGTKHKPFFRMVVVDSRKKRDGEYIENIGTFDTLKSTFVTFSPERYDAWVAQGAQPSDSAKKLYRLFKKQGNTATPEKVEAKKTAPKKVAVKQVEKEAAEQAPMQEKAAE